MMKVIDMMKANIAMENFMKRLANNEYLKENQPGDSLVINGEFINKQVKSYSKLLDSGISDVATK